MTEPRVEALLRNEPIPGLPEQVRAAHKQALRDLVAADPATRPPPRHRRPGRGGGGAAAGSPCSPAGWSWPAPGRPPRS